MVGTLGRSGQFGKTEVDLPSDGGPKKPLLPEAVGKKWDELIEQLPKGSLRRIDGHELRILSELLSMSDVLAESCQRDPSDHKTARVYLNVVGQVHRISSAFGLNPGDRKRLGIAPATAEPDAFEQWKSGYGVEAGK